MGLTWRCDGVPWCCRRVAVARGLVPWRGVSVVSVKLTGLMGRLGLRGCAGCALKDAALASVSAALTAAEAEVVELDANYDVVADLYWKTAEHRGVLEGALRKVRRPLPVVDGVWVPRFPGRRGGPVRAVRVVGLEGVPARKAIVVSVEHDGYRWEAVGLQRRVLVTTLQRHYEPDTVRDYVLYGVSAV